MNLQAAPDFSLPDETGSMVSLSDFVGQKNLVLFFYPKDDSPGCSAQVCAFRDSYEAFGEAGAEVIGISSDSVESHARFRERKHLPFRLLSDEGGRVRRKYGVPSTFGLIPGRVTFVIDRQGLIRYSFNSQFDIARHVRESLRILSEG